MYIWQIFNKISTMRRIYLYIALFFGITYTSCENRKFVSIKGSCENYTDGTPVELYYYKNDSIIIASNDTLSHGEFDFTIEDNPNMAYYVSVNDTLNPARGILFAEKGTVNIVFDSTYHISGTPLNNLYNTYLTETRRIERLGEIEYHRSIEGKGEPDTSVFDSLLRVFTDYKVKFQLDNMHNIVGKTTFINEIGSVYDPNFLETYPSLPEEVKANKKVKWYYELRLDMDRKQKELDAKIGIKILDMELPDANGVKRKLSSFIPKDGYLYIDLWSSGCAPCIAEFPELEKTYSQYKEKGLNVLLISVDKNMEDFQSAMKKYQIKFTSLIDTTEEENVKKNFPYSGIPHGILINSNGEIVANQLHNTLLKKKLTELIKN